jgi:hypothetical protein
MGRIVLIDPLAKKDFFLALSVFEEKATSQSSDIEFMNFKFLIYEIYPAPVSYIHASQSMTHNTHITARNIFKCY